MKNQHHHWFISEKYYSVQNDSFYIMKRQHQATGHRSTCVSSFSNIEVVYERRFGNVICKGTGSSFHKQLDEDHPNKKRKERLNIWTPEVCPARPGRAIGQQRLHVVVSILKKMCKATESSRHFPKWRSIVGKPSSWTVYTSSLTIQGTFVLWMTPHAWWFLHTGG